MNLVYPYSELKAPNVGGTREVLRLACRHGARPLHYVSTNGIFPPDMGLCEEDIDLDDLADARDDGYGRSKWVAEKLVREAGQRGLPVNVYRPGIVSGHSETGASNPRDLLGAVIVESLRLGCGPEIEDWRMEMTPVDFVAGAMLHIASNPAAYGRTYHLANPDPPSAEDVFDLLEEQGYPLERVPYDEWLQRIDAAPPEEGTPGEILGGAAPAEEELRDDNTYDDGNTRRALGDGADEARHRRGFAGDLRAVLRGAGLDRGFRHRAQGVSRFEARLVGRKTTAACGRDDLQPHDPVSRGGSRTALTYIHVGGIDFEDIIESHDLAHDLFEVLLRGGRAGQFHDAFPDVAHHQVRAVEQFGHVVLDALDIAEEGVYFHLAGIGVDVGVVARVSGVRGV